MSRLLPRRPSALFSGRANAAPPWIPHVDRSTAVVDCAVYVDGQRMDVTRLRGGGVDWADAHRQVANSGRGFVWIGLHEPSEAQLAGVAEHFGLHPLAVEDALIAGQRPKLEAYDDMTFAVLRTVHYDESGPTQLADTPVEVVETGEIMVFLGHDYVITVRHGAHGALHAMREQLEADPERLMLGPSVVLHAILDRVVDAYLLVARDLQQDIEDLENEVFRSARRTLDTNRVYVLKREVVALRRAATPLMVPLGQLGDEDVPLIASDTQEYFRDVSDHLRQAIDSVAAIDDLLNTLLSAHLAQVSVVQNADMRMISAWVAIAAVPTMVAGIYGMNFDSMPELHWRFGYPTVLVCVSAFCLLLYRRFKRSGWL